MKQIFKNLLSVAAFFLGLAILLALLSPVFSPKDNRAEYGMEDLQANGILAEPENSIDVLIIGDSETFSAFVPLQMWKEQGISNYVFGTFTQLICETDFYLQRILEHQSPKVIVLETNALYTDSGYGRVVSAKVASLFPVMRYHDRWKHMLLEDFTARPHYSYLEPNKGYMIRTAVEPASTEGYMEPTDAVAPVPTKNRILLRGIRDLCRRNGAELILVSSPSTANWSYLRHNGVAAAAEALGLSYLDMNLYSSDMALDWNVDTLDGGDHLNYDGAVKATAFLGSFLHDNYPLPDHREDPAFAQWNAAQEDFYQRMQAE